MLDYSDWHDNAESFWCGAHVEYDFCNDIDGDCGGHLGQSGAGNIKNYDMDENFNWIFIALNRIELRHYDA